MANLKDTLENHPISVFTVFAIAVVSITAGTVGWFWYQSLAIEKNISKQQITSIRNDLNGQIEDLKRRLISIERRVGGSSLYLDVSKLSIASTEIPSLEKEYKSFQDGKFFVLPPSFDEWSQAPASQLDLAAILFGDDLKQEFKGSSDMMEMLSKKSGVIWQGKQGAEIALQAQTPFYKMGTHQLNIRPFVFAFPLDESLIQRTTQGVMLHVLKSDKNEKERLDKLLSETKGLIASFNKDNGTEKPEADAKTPINENRMDDESITQLIDSLAAISRDDLAGYILLDQLTSHFMLSLATGSSMKVVAADKKGNVLYIHLHTVFPAEKTKDGAVGNKLVLDEEIFFVGNSKGGLLIRTGIPSKDLRSPAYAWTHGWLASLRIPLY